MERAHSEWMRSRELFSRSESLSERIVENLRRFNGRTFGDSGDTFRLRLARIRPAVALIRHDLGRWLEARGVASNDVREIVLACSEACANAVEHPIEAAEQAFVVEAALRDGEVEIVVRDSGHWQVGPGVETRGRGMDMIRALTSEMTVVDNDHGTAIVMRRQLR